MEGKNVTTFILSREHITLPDKARVIAAHTNLIRVVAYAASCLSTYVSYPPHAFTAITNSGNYYAESLTSSTNNSISDPSMYSRAAYDMARRDANFRLLTDLDNLIGERGLRPSVSEQRAGWMRVLTLSEGRGAMKGFKLQVATNGFQHWVYLAPARYITPHGPEEQWGEVTRYG